MLKLGTSDLFSKSPFFEVTYLESESDNAKRLFNPENCAFTHKN